MSFLTKIFGDPNAKALKDSYVAATGDATTKQASTDALAKLIQPQAF